MKKVEARQAVEQALADVEAALKSSLAGTGSAGASGRRGDDPLSSLPLVVLAIAAGLTGSPTGRAPSSSSGRATSPRPACSAPSSCCCCCSARALVAWSAAALAVVEPGQRRPLPQPAAREARARCAVERHHRHRRRRPRRWPPAMPARRARRCRNEPLTHLLRAQAAQLDRRPHHQPAHLRGHAGLARHRAARPARPVPGGAARGRAGGGAPVRRARAASSTPSSTGRWRRCSTCSAAPATGRARSIRWRSPGARACIDKTVANRRRAVLLTAQAQAAEDTARRQGAGAGAGGASAGARPGAGRRHRRPHPGLARQHAARRARAAQDLAALAPHPDLAAAYAYARPGDSPRDRLNRVRHLGAPHAARYRGADRVRHHGHRGARVGRGAQGAGAAAGRPPDAARRHPDGPHRGRAARPCRPRARMAGARRQRAARSRLDRRWRRLRPLGAGVAGHGRARCLPLARAGRGARAAPCWRPRSRRWPASAPAPSPRSRTRTQSSPPPRFRATETVEPPASGPQPCRRLPRPSRPPSRSPAEPSPRQPPRPSAVATRGVAAEEDSASASGSRRKGPLPQPTHPRPRRLRAQRSRNLPLRSRRRRSLPPQTTPRRSRSASQVRRAQDLCSAARPRRSGPGADGGQRPRHRTLAPVGSQGMSRASAD